MPLTDRFSRTSRVVATLACVVVASTGMIVPAAASPALPVRATPEAARPFHLHLEKSEPAKDQELTSPPTVLRFWYSLPPELAVTAVKLSRADGAPVPTAKPRRGKDVGAVEVDIKEPLAAGSYVVTWKTSSKDGHPVSGDFAFSIKGGA